MHTHVMQGHLEAGSEVAVAVEGLVVVITLLL